MIEILLTGPEGNAIVQEPCPGCWVNVVAPTQEDRDWLSNELGVVPEFLKAILDDKETSHTDYDDDAHQTLVIVDCPFVMDQDEAEDASITQYDTHPLSFVFLYEQDLIVTVSVLPNNILTKFMADKRTDTRQRTRLLLRMLWDVAHGYVVYLKSIERQMDASERNLRETMENSELIKMLGFEKSLVYFSTSLKGVQATLSRISSGRVVKLYDDDKDLLEDVVIELNQAAEMCSVETQVLNGIMETFGSVISNNLNITMRTLTVITLVLSIPTMIFSFYGMNVEGLPWIGSIWIPLLISLIACAISIVYFKFNKRLR